MKYLFYCVLIGSICACHKPSESISPPVDSIKASVANVSLSGALNSRDSFEIQTSNTWMITFLPADPSWIGVSETKGTGTKKIIVTTTQENNTGSDRSVVLKITTGGTASANVSITQRLTGSFSITVFAGSGGLGTTDGVGTSASFAESTGLTSTGSGNIFVCDLGGNAIRKITPSAVVSTFAGIPLKQGNSDGPGGNALFNYPFSICSDANENLFVGDHDNNSVRKITPSGNVTTVMGNLSGPTGVAVDSAGNIYVVTPNTTAVQRISPSGQLSVFVGDLYHTGSGDGTGTSAQFNGPGSITIAPSGNIYVLDWDNLNIRKITPAGVVTTVAGSLHKQGFDNGPGNVASFNKPRGIAADKNENLYIADVGNNAIRKIDANGNVTTLINNVSKYHLDANYTSAYGVAVDKNGVLWIANTGESRILKVIQ